MLIIEELSFQFANRVILDRVSLHLRRGAVTCLLGGNGAGKTTLFNLITGFLRPTTGSISFGDKKIMGLAPFRICRLGVARTFQDLRLVGELSVRDNVLLALPTHTADGLARALLPAYLHFAPDLKAKHEADALLAEFLLAEVADQPASEISYGQQKLLTLACCVATGASLLLLDEPVAGISPDYRGRIAERLASLRAGGKTILLIEHQRDFLENTGEVFLFLQGGRLQTFETLATLAASPAAPGAFD